MYAVAAVIVINQELCFQFIHYNYSGDCVYVSFCSVLFFFVLVSMWSIYLQEIFSPASRLPFCVFGKVVISLNTLTPVVMDSIKSQHNTTQTVSFSLSLNSLTYHVLALLHKFQWKSDRKRDREREWEMRTKDVIIYNLIEWCDAHEIQLWKMFEVKSKEFTNNCDTILT